MCVGIYNMIYIYTHTRMRGIFIRTKDINCGSAVAKPSRWTIWKVNPIRWVVNFGQSAKMVVVSAIGKRVSKYEEAWHSLPQCFNATTFHQAWYHTHNNHHHHPYFHLTIIDQNCKWNQFIRIKKPHKKFENIDLIKFVYAFGYRHNVVVLSLNPELTWIWD